MNFKLFFQPDLLVERMAAEIKKRRRLKKLSGKPGVNLKAGHIDALELLEIINADPAIIKRAVIFDVGGNTGTWTLLAKSIMPDAVVHAFEPLKDHVTAFAENCAQLPDVSIHQFCAGNVNAMGIINVSSFSDSSSLLDATPLEYDHFGIKKEKEEGIEIKRLGDLITAQVLPAPMVIKLDIQGYELEAIKGLGPWIAGVRYLICEVSFKPYYVGQAQFLEVANYLSGWGFQIFAFGYNTPVGAELNQIDVLFKITGGGVAPHQQD